jgi:hypothetical protein
MPKLTQWYPGTIKPAREGVYQKQLPTSIVYSRWWGGKWRALAMLADDAARQTQESAFAGRPWRGLAEEPK